MTLHKNQKGFNENLVCCSKLHHIIITTLIPSSKLSLFVSCFCFSSLTLEKRHTSCVSFQVNYLFGTSISLLLLSRFHLLFFSPLSFSCLCFSSLQQCMSCASHVMTAGTSSLHLSFRDSVPRFATTSFACSSHGIPPDPVSLFPSIFLVHLLFQRLLLLLLLFPSSSFPVVLCLEFCLSFSFFFFTVSSL